MNVKVRYSIEDIISGYSRPVPHPKQAQANSIH